MSKIENSKVMLLLKRIFLTITLFSVLVITTDDVWAANFKYSEFNFEEFANNNREYWEGFCQDDEDCQNEILKSQEKFYKKLYKILAKYEAKGLYINDNILLETIFFEMTPSTFADNPEEYRDEWQSNSGAYIIDEENDGEFGDLVEIEEDWNNEEMVEYYATEKDTIKTLVKNAIAYTTSCYGIYGDPTKHTRDDNSVYYTCDNGGNLVDINNKTKCADTLSNNELGFWQYYPSRLAHDSLLGIPLRVVPFLGAIFEDEYYDACEAQNGEYPEGTKYIYKDDKHVSIPKYWEFLMNNIYFDRKAHLQEYFKEDILDPAGVKCMTNDVCDDSLENAGLYEEYSNEIYEVRREIIDNIIEILKNYGIDASYENMATESFQVANGEEATRKSFYWPIGSDETEVRNGITFADKDPASTEVISYFGTRNNPVTGESEFHHGIDIAGIDGVTNVIAVYNGEVITIVDNCSVGDYECNDGYGKMIIISHTNGDYTVYAHLASIDSQISVGSSVERGELIGKVGATGKTLTANLHYELRIGGNDVTQAVDPLGVTSISNPRPQEMAGDFSVHMTSLTREEFITKLRSYCNTHSCSSVMSNVFIANAGLIYDVSISNNVNPELVVVRAIAEGFSPGTRYNNYWGIGCTNGTGYSNCANYGSLTDGIKGFANATQRYTNASDMMQKYAYIGKYWFNPGGSGSGGCYYFPYIKTYISPARVNIINNACAPGNYCDTNGNGECLSTTSEDQTAYATWQVNQNMSPLRYNIFGL